VVTRQQNICLVERLCIITYQVVCSFSQHLGAINTTSVEFYQVHIGNGTAQQSTPNEVGLIVFSQSIQFNTHYYIIIVNKATLVQCGARLRWNVMKIIISSKFI